MATTTMFQRPRVEDGLSDEEVFPFGDNLSPRKLYFQPNSTAKSSFLSDEYSRKSLREHSAPTEGNEKVGLLERRLSLNLDPKISSEVVRFSEEKAAGLRNSKGEEWSVSLKHRLEEDLDRQVREALDTPPLIRIRRNHEKARQKLQNLWGTLSDEEDQDKLKEGEGCQDDGNHGENKDNEDREDELSRVDTAASEIRAKARHRRKPLHIALQRFQRLQRSNYDEYPGVFGLERSIEEALAEEAEEKKEEEKKALEEEKERETSQYYQPSPSLHLSPRAIRIEMFKGYTRNGFKQLLMTGGNSKHLTRIKSGIYMDRNGIIVTRDGPFWPSEHGPLLPTPRFICASPLEPEKLMSAKDFFQHRTINDNDQSRFPRPWRGKVVVFDSERMAKGQVPHNVPEGCCPSLSFESRFESGNLRQARRIGQYEYELVLKTDLYTSRHTQWFYFRVQNALPGITYKFQIVNLLKRDSLYNYGMRPLVYSDRMARDRTIGWHRSGHHISYYQFYNTSRNPLLQPDITYFCLEWQMEFPYEEDTYYLAHCYPYTYTDLKEHLDDLCNNEETGRHVRRDVLCETRAGNSCFLLTITEFPDEESKVNLRQACHRNKKGVVVSARVHPGETQASWMMKGLLDFLTGESETAKELRENFIFKIVPMLNPDGVIVGNYRCSLAARDLNRNYRNPRKDIFPTVYYIKEMTEAFKRDHEIIVYCDLHGHSRKPNVFMYGCNSIQGRMGLDGAEVFINERLFPWLMAQKAPDKFAFGGCKFQIKKCKESTGRVVMWRTGIMNSFTMEATFCGTEKLGSGPPRHFNIKDFQDIGKTFCEVVLDYVKTKENKSKQSAMILDLTRHITHMILQKRDMMPTNQPDLNDNNSDNEELSDDEEKEKEEKTSSKPSSSSDRETSKSNVKSTKPAKEKKSKAAPKAVLPPHLLESPEYKDEKGNVDVNKMIEAMSTETIEGCIRLLEQLEVTKTLSESDTSEDSDSESEPEMKDPPKRKKKKKKQKRTKSLSALPAMNNVEDKQKRNKTTTPPSTNVKIPRYPPFVNRYANRSNHGIPIFSQERLQERAQKSLEKQKAALRLRQFLRQQYPPGAWTCRVEEKEKTRPDDRQQTANVYYADEDNYKRFQSWMSMSRAVQAQKQKSSQDIRNTFRLALSGQPDVFKHSYTHAGSMPPVSLQSEQLVHIGPEIRSVEPRLNQAAYPVNKPFNEDSEFSISSDDSENQRFKIPMADLKSPYQRDMFPQQWGEGHAARPPTHGRRAGVSPRASADQNQVIRVRLTTRPDQRLPSVDRLGSGSSSGKDTAKDNVLSRPGRQQPVVSRNIKSALSNDVLQSMAELTHSMFPRQPEGLLPSRGQGSVDQTEVLLERWKLRGDAQMPTSPRKPKPPSFEPLGE
ncbi:uncharacterized protein LOC118404481 isoform X3 [Branchiostoma floridae]|uniref:Uncharacterized protein LOC118404481 isoform X3 n=1 Tax=Branchiostoma floridae TaxID=7739 RepID=A0A9J7KHW3_BRAFL|nr:uncharacterized protein LOC118404481 isoform X3 [Branchiostoma floridae]